jgi:hypothetical protein
MDSLDDAAALMRMALLLGAVSASRRDFIELLDSVDLTATSPEALRGVLAPILSEFRSYRAMGDELLALAEGHPDVSREAVQRFRALFERDKNGYRNLLRVITRKLPPGGAPIDRVN